MGTMSDVMMKKSDAKKLNEKQKEEVELMRVTYISDFQCPEHMFTSEIYNVVHVAGLFNRAHEISGIFCVDVNAMVCMQLFEGEKEKVEVLWERIQGDRRHIIRHDSVQISTPEKLLSTQWGMPLIHPLEMCQILEKRGIDTKNAIKSLFAGQPEDTMTKMWGKRQEKKEKKEQKKLNREQLNKILEAAKAEFKLSMEKSKAVLRDAPDAGFEKELAIAASLLNPEANVRMPEISVE